MALYDYPRDKHPNMPLPQYLRRPNSEVAETIAMHWDGTYRDRLVFAKGAFWDGREKDSVLPSRQFAKHLA